MPRRRVSVRKGWGWTAIQYEPQIEGCRSRFHRKGRKDRKDNVTLTLRPLRWNISLFVYFNSHSSPLTAPHFPTHAQRMSKNTRSAARWWVVGQVQEGSAGEWRMADGERVKGWMGAWSH